MSVGEWDRRELCPDGTCTGLIGPSGTCKVCGRAAPNWGDERNRGLRDEGAEPGRKKKRKKAAAPEAEAEPAIAAEAAVEPEAEPVVSGVEHEHDEDGGDDDGGGDEDDGGDDDDDDGDDEDGGDADDGDEEPDDDDGMSALMPSSGSSIGGEEWAKRALCTDGACTGVIADDGKCKVCGKPP